MHRLDRSSTAQHVPARGRVAGLPRAALVAAALALTATLGAAASAQAATTETFSYTGDEQTFVVPPGVYQLWVDAVGGDGGNHTDSPGSTDGGSGAYIQKAALSVQPGQTLYLEVGGNGGGSSPNYGGAGGFNGGGDGGAGGGGGGGATDIRTVSRAESNTLES